MDENKKSGSKNNMIEIRIHGRGGQGAKSASQLIVEAALDQGKQIQAFPESGPERTGAPMKTYARISDRPITTYEPVLEPDTVLVIDPTLIGQIDVTEGLKKDGVLIVNTVGSSADIRKKTGFGGKVYTVDATGISIDLIGRNLPNTPMIGALIKVTNVIEMRFVEKRVQEMFLKKIGQEKTDANISAIKRAFDEVK
ncbi:MAG: 2-oxoacid:acceptor oxidoreductase family protein [Candidatus Aenigmatarchaeota archaeon]|nr:MAG: 2-oxoacid:acceptor oxidoreductase family protein [Candidatus Aenigmarchaeota archaeon]